MKIERLDKPETLTLTAGKLPTHTVFEFADESSGRVYFKDHCRNYIQLSGDVSDGYFISARTQDTRPVRALNVKLVVVPNV